MSHNNGVKQWGRSNGVLHGSFSYAGALSAAAHREALGEAQSFISGRTTQLLGEAFPRALACRVSGPCPSTSWSLVFFSPRRQCDLRFRIWDFGLAIPHSAMGRTRSIFCILSPRRQERKGRSSPARVTLPVCHPQRRRSVCIRFFLASFAPLREVSAVRFLSPRR